MRKLFLYFSLLVLVGGIGFTVYAGAFTTEWNFEEQPDSECSDTLGPTAAVLPASEQAKCWTGGPEEWGGILTGVGITSLGVVLLTIAFISGISGRRMSRVRMSGVDLSGTIPSSFGIPPSGTMAPPSSGTGPPSGSSSPPPPPPPPLISE